MYDAAPVRPRKTSIVRSRGACEMCRKRRRKVCLPTCMFSIQMFLLLKRIHQCDEGRPSCSLCRKNNKPCYYNALTLQFRDASAWAADKVRKLKRTSSVSESWGPMLGETTEPCPSSTSRVDYSSRRASLPAILAPIPSDAILRESLGSIGDRSSKSSEARRPLTSTSDKSALAGWSEPFPTLKNDDPSCTQQWHHQPGFGDTVPFDCDEELSGASLVDKASPCTGDGASVQSITWLLSSADIPTCSSLLSSSVPTGRWHMTCM
jgi:hypothetical protein